MIAVGRICSAASTSDIESASDGPLSPSMSKPNSSCAGVGAGGGSSSGSSSKRPFESSGSGAGSSSVDETEYSAESSSSWEGGRSNETDLRALVVPTRIAPRGCLVVLGGAGGVLMLPTSFPTTELRPKVCAAASRRRRLFLADFKKASHSSRKTSGSSMSLMVARRNLSIV